MPETIEDLGRRVKAKYPGIYDDLQDAEVGNKVKMKFPGAYDDFFSPEEAAQKAGPDVMGRFAKGAASEAFGTENVPLSPRVEQGIDFALGAGGVAGSAARFLLGPTVKNTVGQALSGNVAGAIGAGITDVLTFGLPEFLSRKFGAKASTKLYQSALKPSTALTEHGARTFSAEDIVKIGKENKITVSRGGLEDFWDKLENFNAIQDELIARQKLAPRTKTGAFEMGPIPPTTPVKSQAVVTGPTPGFTGELVSPQYKVSTWKRLEDAKTKQQLDLINARVKMVNPQKVAAVIDGVKQKFITVNPEVDLSALDAVKDEFLRNFSAPLTLEQAQTIKKNTYRVLKDTSYGELKAAEKEGRKALARGLKDQLQELVPELKAVNEKQWELLGLEPSLEKAINRIGNWEMFAPGGLYGILGGIGVGVATGSPAAGIATSALATIIRDPMIKSKLAIAINQASKARGLAGGTALTGKQVIEGLLNQLETEK